jgi:hypothetical protein
MCLGDYVETLLRFLSIAFAGLKKTIQQSTRDSNLLLGRANIRDFEGFFV